MTRITISNGHWFNEDTAIEFSGRRTWNGSNMICGHGSGQWGGQSLYYTKSGNWVLETRYNGDFDHNQIGERAAVQWLVNNHDYEPAGLPKKVTKEIKNQINALEI